MRGDRRSPQRQPVRRQNAADAGARALHSAVPAGNRPLICREVRLQLAAYRRDDWSTGDLSRFADHLASCAECRKIEASYREAGEKLRQLPSIAPPPNFREAVFAAIRADQQRITSDVARAARAATNPALPVVRPIPIARRRHVSINPRAALAVAAILLLTLATAKVLPAAGLASLGRAATSLSPLRLADPTRPTIATYPLDRDYTMVTSAIATSAWLIYSASNGSGGSMLLAESRKNRQISQLLASPSAVPLTVRAVTDRWVIWTQGSGDASSAWSLHASPLPPAAVSAASPLALIDSASATDPTPTILGGVWASGESVLVAGTTFGGYGVLLRYDLSSGTPVARTLAHTSSPGHLLTDPSVDGTNTYWADVWYDSNVLHSAIWRLNSSGSAQQISSDDGAFHPAASGGALVWVDVPPNALNGIAPERDADQANADVELVNELNGGLRARDLATGQQWQISPRADVSSLQGGGSLLLWRTDSQTHVYDLRAKSPADVDQQVRTATLAAASRTSVVWETSTSAPLDVYDAP